MGTLTIKELRTTKEIVEGFPVMKQLRNHLDEKAYVELVLEA